MENNKTEETATQGLLPLPYEPISAAPNRDTIRSHKGNGYLVQGKQNYSIHIDRIVIREGFNARLNIDNLPFEEFLEKVLKISEIAEQMLASGYPPPPIKGDFTSDASGFIPTDGHRRYYGIMKLIADGHTVWPRTGAKIEMIEIEPLPKEFTELDRAKLVIHSQNNLQLTPLEYGHQFRRLNKVFGMSHEDIAKEFNGDRSRQWVTNMIALAELPMSVQKQVNSGNLTTTAALTLKTNIKDEKQLEETVQASVDAGKGITVKEAQQAGQQVAAEDYLDYKQLLTAITDECVADVLNCVNAIPKINHIRAKAAELLYGDADEMAELNASCLTATKTVLHIQEGKSVDEYQPEEDTESFKEAKEQYLRGKTNIDEPYHIETNAADEKSEASGVTSAKFRDDKPKDEKDALPDIDFSHEKEEGIMDLTECIGMLDKISNRVKNTSMPVQHRDDIMGMCEAVIRRVTKAKEILTKAADKR